MAWPIKAFALLFAANASQLKAPADAGAFFLLDSSMHNLYFEGVRTSCKRRVPQWIADEAIRLSRRERGMHKEDLERAIRLQYPSGSSVEIMRVASGVIRAAQRCGRIAFLEGAWRHTIHFSDRARSTCIGTVGSGDHCA